MSSKWLLAVTSSVNRSLIILASTGLPDRGTADSSEKGVGVTPKKYLHMIKQQHTGTDVGHIMSLFICSPSPQRAMNY